MKKQSEYLKGGLFKKYFRLGGGGGGGGGRGGGQIIAWKLNFKELISLLSTSIQQLLKLFLYGVAKDLVFLHCFFMVSLKISFFK